MIASVVSRLILHPIFVFTSIWVLMISLYLLGISTLYLLDAASLETLAGLFLGSLLVFILSFCFVSLVMSKNKSIFNAACGGRVSFLLRTDWIYLLGFIVLVSVLYNYVTYGPPPLIAKLGGLPSKYTYLTYGRFKNIIHVFAYVMVLLAIFDGRRFVVLGAFFYAFCIFALYINRGPMLVLLVQSFIFILLSANKQHKKYVFAWLLGVFFFAAVILALFGNLRTGGAHFLDDLAVKQVYRSCPTAINWFILYVSAPLANVVSFAQSYYNFNYGLYSLSVLLPPMLVTHFQHGLVLLSQPFLPNKNNTVSTYLGIPYLDFGWIGIVFINIFYGVVSALSYHFVRNNEKTFANTLYAVICSSLVFLCFVPYLIEFGYWLEFALLAFIFLSNPDIFQSDSISTAEVS